MFFKLKVSCTCHCDYYISERISTEKVVCPNCGKEHPYSHKIISMLHTANEIQDVFDSDGFDIKSITTEVIL